MGNVEIFELCEITPKVHCSLCLLCWNQGIVCCTCGHFLVESESSPKFHKLRQDALPIPHYVIKKGRCHGARHGKTEELKKDHKARNARKRCCKKSWLSRWTFQRYSRSLSQRPSLSWITTRNWLDRAEVHRNGKVGTGRPLPPSIQRWIPEISKSLVSHIKQIGQECTDATSIRLPSRSHNHEPSPPRITRRTCRTYSFSTTSKMALFFIKCLMVELGHVQKLVELVSSMLFFWICCGSFRLQLIAICCNRRVCKQYTSNVTFSCSEHALIVAHHTAWLKNVFVRVVSSA